MLALVVAALALNCGSPANQSEMNQCARLRADAADRNLNAEWRETRAWAARKDAQIDRSYDSEPTFSGTLLEAQRGWIAYKDAHCRMLSWQARGGSLAPLLFSECIANLTMQRVRELHDLRTAP